MADQPEPAEEQSEGTPEAPADGAMDQAPSVVEGAPAAPDQDGADLPATEDQGGADPAPVAVEDADEAGELAAHVEVPSDPPTSEGTQMVQWVGAGVLTVVLAGVLLVAARKSRPQPTLQSPFTQQMSAAPEVAVPAPDAVADTPQAEQGLVSRFRQALTRTGAALRGQFDGLFGRPIDEQLFEDLEEVLLVADVGMPTTERIIEKVRAAASGPDPQPEVLREAMRSEMHSILSDVHTPMIEPSHKPWVMLVVGVNGSGKTTTIGKLAARYQAEGKSVLVAAGDTYRAAAAEQLAVWAERAGADIVQGKDGADPGAVTYDALTAAKARDHDIVLVDTAGRLQTAKPLMDQLAKIRRVIDKVVPGAPHETLLVVDGTIGQNAMSQAKLFNEATPLTGVVVTKLDGTAKGGMILALASEMSLPVKLVGVGEQIADLRDFEPAVFVDAVS